MQDGSTYYAGQRFDNVLQARWAVFLDTYFLCNSWQYQPAIITDPLTGTEYQPDFLFSVGPFDPFLEVSPTFPKEGYLDSLRPFLPLAGRDVWLGFGDFANNVPCVINLTDSLGHLSSESTAELLDEIRNAATPISSFPWFPSANSAIETARDFVFDNPNARASIRQGTQASLQAHISKWTNEQRKRNRPKPRRRPQSPN